MNANETLVDPIALTALIAEMGPSEPSPARPKVTEAEMKRRRREHAASQEHQDFMNEIGCRYLAWRLRDA